MKTHSPNVEIIEFNESLSSHVKTLNYEWLEKYFRVEPGDEKSLSNPKQHIIDKGGQIYYAIADDKIVGTAALMKKDGAVYELGKMAVTDSAQGLGIGTLLLKHCLEKGKELKAKRLVLYSNTLLASAIHLYKKYGFNEVELESGLYERANIKMEKELNSIE